MSESDAIGRLYQRQREQNREEAMIENAMISEDSSDKNNSNDAQKLGLALSGGGFRASLFHIGVLMALAEMGLLHKIEVISTVSGGSIIGALYYLRLRELLQERADAKILPNDPNPLGQGDYLELVKKMKVDFIEGVSYNLRTRVFSNLKDNLKMALPSYSRSDRIDQLYDKYFYGNKKTLLRNIKIAPKGESGDFHPERDNHRRIYKAPILVINATTLNTGHNWRFRARNMGEPPVAGRWPQDVDKNMRLRRPKSWEDTVPQQADFPLSSAVAASACVPGLFHPLAISGMYETKSFDGKIRDIRVQLVDGGVYDNLGVKGLMGKRCTMFIVSDASGHLKDIADPSTNIVKVLGRMNSILMDRVREEELFSLTEKYPGKVAYVHLRKGIPAREAHYLNSAGNPEIKHSSSPKQPETSMAFEVNERVQYRLSAVRTDLDSFTEIEAEALIADARLMSRYQIPVDLGIAIPTEATRDGAEARIERLLKCPTSRFLKHLETAGSSLFKVFKLSPALAFSIAVAIYGPILWGSWILFSDDFIYYAQNLGDTIFAAILNTILENLLISIVVALLGTAGAVTLRALKLTHWVRPPIHFLTRALPALIIWPIVWIHLLVFDNLFKSVGEIKRLK